jgi:hypothetical protein
MNSAGVQTMDLDRLQRAMAAAVMLPLTADEGMRAVAPDGRPMTAIAESFIAPNSRLTAFERLEIYNRQYWFRVLGALAEDFPALRAVVGSRRFESLSVAYLVEHPSRSFTLRNLGSQLPQWLLMHPEQAGPRHRLAVDVARIEWAFVEAFDSAALAPLGPDRISALHGASRLALQPHLQLMALNYPADDLVLDLHRKAMRGASEAGVKHQASQAGLAAVPGLRPRASWLAAHRVDLTVFYRRMEREEFLVLEAIGNGRPLGEAIEAGFANSRIPAGRRAQRVREWFATWAELGWICEETSLPVGVATMRGES